MITVSRDFPRKGKTDWARVDALTDEDIAKAVANDPDAAPIDIDWSDAVLVIPPKKKAISIRVDEDVLDFFKRDGEGYQRRMNAVLRSYMEQKSKPKKRA
ncbi:BrnA antitoxin family protein [Bradyrhizobium sp. LB12.1]|uniref:BrnA antitoxin family protein n=1 Tax=Bradyrhizobium sp. LB12.1 TaxID=3156327 RepID=UPI00339704EF